MRVRKEMVLAVVISAALITAGLLLSCGDDGGVSCKDACERLEECELIPGDFGDDVEDCVEFCEDGLDQGDEAEEAITDLLECVMDTDCDDIEDDCIKEPFCEIACDIYVECEFIGPGACEGWVNMCIDMGTMEWLLCVLEFAPDCDDIENNCMD